MTDNTNPGQSENNAPAEAENAEDPEAGFDDADYTPNSIKRLLDNPPLLPGENRDLFVQLFEEFESTDLGRAKTVTEYVLVHRYDADLGIDAISAPESGTPTQSAACRR